MMPTLTPPLNCSPSELTLRVINLLLEDVPGAMESSDIISIISMDPLRSPDGRLPRKVLNDYLADKYAPHPITKTAIQKALSTLAQMGLINARGYCLDEHYVYKYGLPIEDPADLSLPLSDRIKAILGQAFPGSISRKNLAELLQMETTNGSFCRALSDLTTIGFITSPSTIFFDPESLKAYRLSLTPEEP